CTRADITAAASFDYW
nr:immunoglobulin heavy chain junction region [Macaca mulatta]